MRRQSSPGLRARGGGRRATLWAVELGRIGIWRRHQEGLEPAAEIDALGFGALWLGGSPSLEQARPFLEQTTTITVATGILNVWRHEPADVAAEHARLRAEFGERFLLGVGIGHPESTGDYSKPLTKMRANLQPGSTQGSRRCRATSASSRRWARRC